MLPQNAFYTRQVLFARERKSLKWLRQSTQVRIVSQYELADSKDKSTDATGLWVTQSIEASS